MKHWFGSLCLGILTFAVWIGPDLLFPAWRESFLFRNAIFGAAPSRLEDTVA